MTITTKKIFYKVKPYFRENFKRKIYFEQFILKYL